MDPRDPQEPEPVPEKPEGSILRERLAKQAASDHPPTLSEPEDAQRGELLAELSKAETREYAVPRKGEKVALQIAAIEQQAAKVTRRTVRRTSKVVIEAGRRGSEAARSAANRTSQAASRLSLAIGARVAAALGAAGELVRACSVALARFAWARRRGLATGAILLLLFGGGVSALWILAPRAWRAAWDWGGETSRALVSAGVEIHRDAELLGLVEGPLQAWREAGQAVEKRRPKRYLLKVITQPAGALVAVADKRFITPGEVELARPEGALRISVRKKSHRPIRRELTADDFKPGRDFMTCSLDLRLEKLSFEISSDRSRNSAETADRPAGSKKNASRNTAPTFWLEPMPPFPKP